MLDTLEKLGGIGASEIGKLFTRDGVKAKTAQTLILEKVEELINGERKEITTIAMQHGIFNEEEAFYNVVQPIYPNANYRSSESIWIKDELWATPDVTDESESLTIDIKCPYTIASFFKNVEKLPNNYIAQAQCQLLATGHERSEICVYLTSNAIDKYGNKVEYDIDINDRHVFIPIQPEKVFQEEIINRYSEFIEKRKILHEMLIDVPVLDDIDFFNVHKTHKVTRLKDKSNLFTWEDKIVKNQGTFYVIEKK
jgi:hypothetical protein